MSTEPIARFFDRECCAAGPPEDPPAPSDPLTARVLHALQDAGFDGGTVLELGSGDGALSIELARRGAQAVSGLDLSPRSVEYAASSAQRAGVGDRVRYQVGDAAVMPLGHYEAVVSKKVFCCYPVVGQLLANTLPAARSAYVLALPESRGAVGFAARLLVRLANAWQALRGDGFRSYVHDVRIIEATIVAAGLRRTSERRRRGWLVLAYRRP